jgi:hypothetical protein
MNEGIEITYSSNSVTVYFGDHLLDVLRILGNPNKEYFKENSQFLNYLEIGLDIMISS